MRQFLLFALLATLSLPALASEQVSPLPMPPSNNISSTITGTGTFQSLQTNVGNRRSCAIQNNGTHTMYVFFGPVANATSTNSVELSAGQSVSCQTQWGILQDQVSITGTSGDAFYANFQ